MLKKVLALTFVLSLIFIAAELVYLFYYQPNINNQPLPTSSVKLKSKNQLKGEVYLRSLIPIVKSNPNITSTKAPFNGISYLKRNNSNLKYLINPNCIELNNQENNWLQYDASSSAYIDIKGPFVVRISLTNKNDLTGIFLHGKRNKPSDEWWQNIYSFFIGTMNDGKHLYVDAKDGTSEKPLLLFEKDTDNITVFNIFFDKNGKNILITDEQYQVIAYLDVNKITKNKFPNGLFPENKVYLGTGAAPKSYLFLLDFSIIPIQD